VAPLAETVVGAVGSLTSVASFAPQAWRIIKTRDTHAIAAATYLLTVTSFATWTAYGILLAQWPLIATNAICFVLSAFILVMKLLPRRARDHVADALDPRQGPPNNAA
jgi:MtN3 and saliva related transmembrane protein